MKSEKSLGHSIKTVGAFAALVGIILSSFRFGLPIENYMVGYLLIGSFITYAFGWFLDLANSTNTNTGSETEDIGHKEKEEEQVLIDYISKRRSEANANKKVSIMSLIFGVTGMLSVLIVLGNSSSRGIDWTWVGIVGSVSIFFLIGSFKTRNVMNEKTSQAERALKTKQIVEQQERDPPSVFKKIMQSAVVGLIIVIIGIAIINIS